MNSHDTVSTAALKAYIQREYVAKSIWYLKPSDVARLLGMKPDSFRKALRTDSTTVPREEVDGRTKVPVQPFLKWIEENIGPRQGYVAREEQSLVQEHAAVA